MQYDSFKNILAHAQRNFGFQRHQADRENICTFDLVVVHGHWRLFIINGIQFYHLSELPKRTDLHFSIFGRNVRW